MKRKGSGSVLYRKRKKQFILVLTAGLLLLLLCGCGAEKRTDAPDYTRLEELEDKRIGVTTGSVQAIQAEERFPNATFYYFSTGVDCLEALRSHKIDAYADAEALVKYMMAENPDLACIEERLASGMQVGAAFPKTELVQQILIPELTDVHLRFKAEYSEAEESAEITVAYGGNAVDPEATDNRLSLTLVKSAVSDLRCESVQGDPLSNRISMRIRS